MSYPYVHAGVAQEALMRLRRHRSNTECYPPRVVWRKICIDKAYKLQTCLSLAVTPSRLPYLPKNARIYLLAHSLLYSCDNKLAGRASSKRRFDWSSYYLLHSMNNLRNILSFHLAVAFRISTAGGTIHATLSVSSCTTVGDPSLPLQLVQSILLVLVYVLQLVFLHVHCSWCNLHSWSFTCTAVGVNNLSCWCSYRNGCQSVIIVRGLFPYEDAVIYASKTGVPVSSYYSTISARNFNVCLLHAKDLAKKLCAMSHI